MSKEAMKLACKALRDCHYYMINAGLPNQSLLNEAFTAYMELEAALAEQPAQQVVDCHATGVCVQSGLRAEQPAQPAVGHVIVKTHSAGNIVDFEFDFDAAEQLSEGKHTVYTSPPAQRLHECSRSHPHENMDAMCKLRTEIARLTNENARLKAQPQQEPVAWMTKTGSVWKTKEDETDQPLYTSPPAQRTWVGLTDEEVDEWTPEIHSVIRAIEAKLKEKNNG